MSTVISRRLRSHPPAVLPWDVLLLVAQEADQATLVALGSSSLDLLAAVVPLLYRTVEIKTIRQLQQLFCPSKEHRNWGTSPPSRINHLLNLSKVQTFHLDFTSLPPTSSIKLTSLNLSFSRILHSDPLPLSLLHLSSLFNQESIPPLLFRSLFPHLNPTRFEYNITHRPFSRTSDAYLPGLPSLSSFTQIEELSFTGTVPYTTEPKEQGPSRSGGLACRYLRRRDVAS